MVSPDRGLTVVRLGKTQDDKLAPLVDGLADIVSLYR
jgi:hypothetical protein